MAAFAQAFARILRTFSGRLGRHESEAAGEAATVPDAPVIGTATRGNTQATVTFTAPASDGGSAITGYTVTSSPGGITGTGSASPIVVTGLTNGTEYTFTVTATNAIGTSAASAASNAVTPATVPGAPTIGTATPGDAAVSVAFTPPASNGGSAITGYTVTSSPGGITASGSSSPINVTGLTNDTAYTFTVTATNAVGTSSASAASNSATPTWPNLLANGTFDNSTGWTVPSNCTISGGRFNFNNTAANVTATHAISGAAGTYRVRFTIVTHASGNITMRFNSGAFLGTSYIDTETGTFTNDIVCTVPITVFEIRVTRDGSSMDCSVDDITIQKIA